MRIRLSLLLLGLCLVGLSAGQQRVRPGGSSVFDQRVAASVRRYLSRTRNRTTGDVGRLVQALNRNAATMQRMLARMESAGRMVNLTRRLAGLERRLSPRKLQAWGVRMTKSFTVRMRKAERRLQRLETAVNTLLRLRNMTPLPNITWGAGRGKNSSWMCSKLSPKRTYRLNSTSCLYVSVERATFSKARQWCRMKGGDLVSLTNKTEATLVQRWLARGVMSKREVLWIGLSDQAREGQFRWLDGARMLFRGWAKGQPDGSRYRRGRKRPDQDCVVMNYFGKWLDLSCRWKSRYMCRF